MKKVWMWIVETLGVHPHCYCGWPLVYRFDNLWICGRCTNDGHPRRREFLRR